MKIQLVGIALVAATTLSACGGQIALLSDKEMKINTSIDQATFTQATKDELMHAKRLGLVVGDKDEDFIRLAEVFEGRGAYNVTLDRLTGSTDKILPSERRSELNKQCKANKIDLALIIVNTNVERGGNATVTGKMMIKNHWTTDMLDCRSRKTMSFSGLLEVNGNVFSDDSDMNRKVGDSLAATILTEIGK